MENDNLMLAVRNTFLCAADPAEAESPLSRSQSWPSLSSSCQSNSDVELPFSRTAGPSKLDPIAKPPPQPVIEQVSGESSGSSGFYNHVANEERQVVPEKYKHWDAARSLNAVPSGLVDGPTQSKGSELHHLCQCRPCGWYCRKNGCKAGALCVFCHMCSEEELKTRRLDKTVVLREAYRETKKAEAERKWAELQDESAPKPIGPHYHMPNKNVKSGSSGYASSLQDTPQAAGKRQKAKKVGPQPNKETAADAHKPAGKTTPPQIGTEGSRFSL